MVCYPFDRKFIEAVQGVVAERCYWDILLDERNIPEAPHIERLNNDGFSTSQIVENVQNLVRMSVEDLVSLSLTDGLQNSPARLVLERSADQAVFERCRVLCMSIDPKERLLGVKVLMRSFGKPFWSEAQVIISVMQETECDEDVIEALIYAGWHLLMDDERSKYVAPFARSEKDALRLASARALGGLIDKLSIDTLRTLTTDRQDEVRNWATFGLRAAVEDPYFRTDLRDVFLDRLNDSHKATRLEAIMGLCQYRDERVISALIAELESPEVWYQAIEAAGILSHPALFDSLTRLQDRSSNHQDELLVAIQNCRVCR